MPPVELELPAAARRILTQARSDRDGARAALAALPVDDQVALVCETPVARRAVSSPPLSLTPSGRSRPP